LECADWSALLFGVPRLRGRLKAELQTTIQEKKAVTSHGISNLECADWSALLLGVPRLRGRLKAELQTTIQEESGDKSRHFKFGVRRLVGAFVRSSAFTRPPEGGTPNDDQGRKAVPNPRLQIG